MPVHVRTLTSPLCFTLASILLAQEDSSSWLEDIVPPFRVSFLAAKEPNQTQKVIAVRKVWDKNWQGLHMRPWIIWATTKPTNSVKWLSSPWVFVAQWTERPTQSSGGLGFDSCRALRVFHCPTLVSCWSIHLSSLSTGHVSFYCVVNKHMTDLRTLPPLPLYNRALFSLDFLPEKSCFLLGCVGTLGVDDWLFLVVLRDRRIPLFFLTGRSSVRGRVASSPVPWSEVAL